MEHGWLQNMWCDYMCKLSNEWVTSVSRVLCTRGFSSTLEMLEFHKNNCFLICLSLFSMMNKDVPERLQIFLGNDINCKDLLDWAYSYNCALISMKSKKGDGMVV